MMVKFELIKENVEISSQVKKEKVIWRYCDWRFYWRFNL